VVHKQKNKKEDNQKKTSRQEVKDLKCKRRVKEKSDGSGSWGIVAREKYQRLKLQNWKKGGSTGYDQQKNFGGAQTEEPTRQGTDGTKGGRTRGQG